MHMPMTLKMKQYEEECKGVVEEEEESVEEEEEEEENSVSNEDESVGSQSEKENDISEILDMCFDKKEEIRKIHDDIEERIAHVKGMSRVD